MNRSDMGLVSRVMGDSMSGSVFYLSPSELFSRVKRLDGTMTPRRFIDAIAAFETHPRFMLFSKILNGEIERSPLLSSVVAGVTRIPTPPAPVQVQVPSRDLYMMESIIEFVRGNMGIHQIIAGARLHGIDLSTEAGRNAWRFDDRRRRFNMLVRELEREGRLHRVKYDNEPGQPRGFELYV